ncbi:hypothetical protein U1Q18_036738 [Sarracenia purpurea var. burkii]
MLNGAHLPQLPLSYAMVVVSGNLGGASGEDVRRKVHTSVNARRKSAEQGGTTVKLGSECFEYIGAGESGNEKARGRHRISS